MQSEMATIIITSVIVVILCCTSCNIASSTDEISQETSTPWRSMYDLLFGDERGHPLQGRQIFTTLMRLNRQMESLSPDDAEQEVVRRWYEANIPDEPKKCSMQHLQYLRDNFASHYRITRNENLKSLYNFTEHNLARFCGQMFDDLGDVLKDESSSRRDITAGLISLSQHYRNWKSDEEYDQRDYILKSMARRMFFLLGVDRFTSSMEFVEAWQNGPCKVVLSRLEQPRLRPYADFVAFMKSCSRRSRDYCPQQTNLWLMVVETCEQLQSPGSLDKLWKLSEKMIPRQKVMIFGQEHQEIRRRRKARPKDARLVIRPERQLSS